MTEAKCAVNAQPQSFMNSIECSLDHQEGSLRRLADQISYLSSRLETAPPSGGAGCDEVAKPQLTLAYLKEYSMSNADKLQVLCNRLEDILNRL